MAKKYSLTEEHRAQLKPWADKWIANAMSTSAMTEEDKEKCRIAVKGLYEAAGKVAPSRERIVFVSSPFILRFASGFASAIWWARKNPGNKLATYAATRAATRAATDDATYAATRAATDDATYAATDDATDAATRAATDAATYAATDAATDDATRAATRAATDAATDDATRAATYAATRAATDDATRAATRAATRDATYAATDDATYAATDDATYAATRAATDDATYAATYAATRAATDAATYAATDDATDDATYAATYAATDDATIKPKEKWFNFDINIMIKISASFGLNKFGLECANNAYRMYQGGNQWSAWDSFLSFFRHIVKLPIDYNKYEHWEVLAELSGPRIVHADFCMISDRPEILLVDEQNRPHCDNGPFCKWRDGSSLYSVHGTRIPGWVVENPELITPEKIFAESNAEIRRIMTEKYGFRRFGQDLIASGKAKLINEQKMWGEPVKYYHYNDGDIKMGFIYVINGTTEPDGTKHEFILTVKADNDNAEQACLNTYPDLMEELKDNPNRFEILHKSVRS